MDTRVAVAVIASSLATDRGLDDPIVVTGWGAVAVIPLMAPVVVSLLSVWRATDETAAMLTTSVEEAETAPA